jgi:hypothetical protein
MTIEAKPLLKNRFWVLEDNGVRIGTLTKDGEGFLLQNKAEVKFFESEGEIKKSFGTNFLTAQVTETNNESSVLGYPTRGKPYNTMFDIQGKLPLFTKSEKSKSVYCAGYYLIKFNVNWLKSFCPKLITIQRNEYLGPFKTDKELKEQALLVNRTT